MYGRAGLDRFKKAQSSEPFSVTANSATKSATQSTFREPALPTTASINQAHGSYQQNQSLNHQNALHKTLTPDVEPTTVPTQQVTQLGGGQSTWQPPDWAIEPRPGVYYLDIVKDGEVLDRINLDKRRHIFGRQFHACDFVLEHQSVSRQHVAVVPHKDGRVCTWYLCFANERLTKNSPVELEVGQSLRFAASTRTYILRKNNDPLPLQPTEIDLPPPLDPSDEEAVLSYNTYINRALNGLKRTNILSLDTKEDRTERAPKRIRRIKVAFKDQVGGELVEIVGFSDGADVETEPGPVGVKEGSLVGKYESLVQITVIPKGKEQSSTKEATASQKGVTEKLQQALNKVKTPEKRGGIYDDLYGDSLSVKVGSSWAYKSGREDSPSKNEGNNPRGELVKSESNLANNDDDNDDDLFG
ncbi:hypothetical protein DH2020_033181 [Rehmannia glutinosa]|uniref:FHA domain-containing protein n=1 Tax=Rehmannia glutinosa TaxID=99300 RepID=A0ABR0VD80_REHGL